MAGGEHAHVTTVTGVRSPAEQNGARGARVVQQRRGLPGGRAVVGGLLMAGAAVGVFAAYSDATAGPSDRVLVAARDLRVGEVLSESDVRAVTGQLPRSVRGTAFDAPSEVAGRVVIGPVAEGEIVQAGAVTRERSSRGHEVALTLPRSQVAVGRLRQGERVDVYATGDDRTHSVVRGVEVVQITDGTDGSLASEREVTLVVVVTSDDDVAAIVHALRTRDVTVVRSTFAEEDGAAPVVYDTGAMPPDDESGSGG